MVVSYTKLWKLLLDKKLKRIDLRKLAGMSSHTLAKLGKDESVSLETLGRICAALDCNIGDIVDFVSLEIL